MTYYTSKCPHCGAYIQFMSKSKDSYGIPFKNCAKCGAPYIDPNCIEPATESYEYKRKVGYMIHSILFALCIAIWPFFGVMALMHFENIIIPAIVGVLILAVVAFFFYRTAVSDYDEQEANWKRQWEASDKRLQNPEYAKALKKAGFTVPLRYFKTDDE